MDMIVENVVWYDDMGERHIAWDVRDTEAFIKDLIDHGVNPKTIEVYEKDVS